jgi:hypothetical protein
VTYEVKSWHQNPGNNHGFILIPMSAPSPVDGVGKCMSGLGSFELVIDFFAP